MNVIGVGSDRRLAGHRPGRGRSSIDRIELRQQAGIARVEQIRFLARRAVKDLDQELALGALEVAVGGVHDESLIERRLGRRYSPPATK